MILEVKPFGLFSDMEEWPVALSVRKHARTPDGLAINNNVGHKIT